MARKGPLADLSGLQLFAGAMAAMTSAWMASWLGVAGTLIGAAVGSVVAGIATTLYSTSLRRGLERSKTLLVTEQGSVVQRSDDAATATVVETDETSGPGSWRDRLAHVNWKRAALVSGAALLVAVVVIGAYEIISGNSFGNSSNRPIAPISQPRDPATPPPDLPGEPSTTATQNPSAEPSATAPSATAEPSEAPTTQAPLPTEPAPPAESLPPS